ncbi:hypothetical protein EJ03DRAFT_165167 [Teratosphaeria nubilosa]|uniref:Uncharacterized protein n=1 Tax=Teratosphaeria nubilosa TaxID=161662 RepID=A0A6G1L226_9PEZI|nr:hypothetical protein EJ03DRAFT_165167 [Teratosphaeria nubilosa]
MTLRLHMYLRKIAPGNQHRCGKFEVDTVHSNSGENSYNRNLNSWRIQTLSPGMPLLKAHTVHLMHESHANHALCSGTANNAGRFKVRYFISLPGEDGCHSWMSKRHQKCTSTPLSSRQRSRC